MRSAKRRLGLALGLSVWLLLPGCLDSTVVTPPVDGGGQDSVGTEPVVERDRPSGTDPTDDLVPADASDGAVAADGEGSDGGPPSDGSAQPDRNVPPGAVVVGAWNLHHFS